MSGKKKIWFFRYDVRTNMFVQVPMTWFSFKRYYELNGKYPDQWEWIKPVDEYESTDWSIDQITDEAISHNADVYMFSSYMWSWDIIKVVASAVRDAHPNAKIILGGPHQGTTYSAPILWFNYYPFFDATCSPNEYGEYFITDMLDAMIEGDVDWSTVRNSFHRKGRGPAGDKRAFKFPTDVISSNLDIAMEYSNRAKESNRTLVMNYETNRGCPYTCSYCEWAGGIGAKVVFKDMDIIKDDISYWKQLNVGLLHLNDANFGMPKRDVEIMQMFIDQKPVLKEVVVMGLAKTTNEKRLAVLEPLVKEGLITSYGVSVQSLDPQVVKNIERTDVPPEDNIELARYLIDTYGINPNLEFILGLPGCKPETFYKEIEVDYLLFNSYRTGLFSAGTRTIHHFPLWVLPDSPAADPAYIEKFKIKLVPIGMETSVTRVTGDNKYVQIFNDKKYKKVHPMFTPVASYSYTTDDWKEMFFMNDMSMLLMSNHLLKPLIDFLYLHREILPRETYKRFFGAFTSAKSFYEPAEKYLDRLVNGEAGDISWREMEVGPVTGSYSLYGGLVYSWITNLPEVFTELKNRFEMDEMLLDLFTYLENSTFRAEGPITWTSEWRWDLWEKVPDKSVMPIKESVTFTTTTFTPEQEQSMWQIKSWIRNMNTRIV